jgi:hypothetical protein
MHFCSRLAKVSVVAAVLIGAAFCQTKEPATAVRISGRILDASGAPILNASVSLRLADHSEIVATTSSGRNGTFACGAVLPNSYDLSIEADGLQTVVKRIRVDGGKDLELGSIVMAVGPARFMDPIEAAQDKRPISPDVLVVSSSAPQFADISRRAVAGKSDENEPTKTTLCELVKTPDQFNGKMVQFRAEFVSRFQWEGFVDESCSAKLQIGGSHPLDDLKPEQGQYAFTTPADDNDHPERLNWKPIPVISPVNLKQDDNYTAFRKCADTKFRWPDGGACLDCPLYRITVKATGRFDHFETDTVAVRANAVTKASHISYMDAPLSRLVLQSVSEVSAIPIDGSVYSEGKRRDISREEANDLVCALTRGCEDGNTVLVPKHVQADTGFYRLDAWNRISHVGFFDVDSRTGDVWSGVLFCVRIESPALTTLQRAIRQRTGLTDEEYKKVPKAGPMCEPGQKPRVERWK